MATELYMPKMSDHMEEGQITKWLVKEGERVSKGQIILELETDKVSAHLESPASGILRGIREGADEGATIPVGEIIAFVATADEEIPHLRPLLSTGNPPAGSELLTLSSSPLPDSSSEKSADRRAPGQVRASPASRKLAKELGVSLALVTGTGPGGRITEEDVRKISTATRSTDPQANKLSSATPVASRIASEFGVAIDNVTGTGPGGKVTGRDVRSFAESQAPEAFALGESEGEWLALTSIQRVSGQRMLASVQTAPQFNLTISVDLTQTLLWRDVVKDRVLAESGAPLSITGILVKIVAHALVDSPQVNASFVDGRIRLHRQINIGVAIGTEQGLIVPVLKDANHKSLAQLAMELTEFQQKARQNSLGINDLSGGTFTISNLGMYGIERFTAIVNPPESAILAVGRVINTPVGLPDDTIALRPIMQLTLSVDHRSMDGMQGAIFLAKVKERIENPYLLI